jgi:hypothetical protein
MKKRRTREDYDARKRKRMQIAISIGFVFLMVFSSIAFYFVPDENALRYNGHVLKAQADANGYIVAYTTEINDEELFFYASPDTSSTIALPEGVVENIQSAPLVVILFDPKSNLTPIYDQIRFEFSEAFSAQVAAAVTEPSAQYPTATVAKCEDAQGAFPILKFQEGQLSIYEEDGCTVLQGRSSEWALLRDRIMYRYYNITTS